MRKIYISLFASFALFVMPNVVLAQLCEDTDPSVYFQTGTHPASPHFPTPDEAGIEDCDGRGTLSFKRVEKIIPEPSSALWGKLFCQYPNGNERELGEVIFMGCCNHGETLKNGTCVAEPIDDADENLGCTENQTKNPCNIATGNKYRSEVDIRSAILPFTRSYNSLNLVDIGIGNGWRHSYQRKLGIDSTSINVISSAGKGEIWSLDNGVWVGEGDSDIKLTQTTTGYEITRPNDSKEQYDAFGRIISETDARGNQTIYSYGYGGFLEKVTNHYGESISFSYSNRRLVSVVGPLGEEFYYEYDTNGKLTDVVYPNATPSDDTDNPRKIYHYENPDFPNHLTGITDENGHRYATFEYDTDGKAILSELGTTTNSVGQEKIELDYQGAN